MPTKLTPCREMIKQYVSNAASDAMMVIVTVLASRDDIDGAFTMLDMAARINDLDLGAVAIAPTLAGP